MLNNLKEIEKGFRKISALSGKLMVLNEPEPVYKEINNNSELFGLDAMLASKIILKEIEFYRKIAKDLRKNFEPTISHQISVTWLFSLLKNEDETGKLVAFCHDWIEDRRDFLIRGGEWAEAEKERLFLELRMEFREYLRKLGLEDEEQEIVFENVLALTRNRKESYASYVQNIVKEGVDDSGRCIILIKLIDKLHNSCSFLDGELTMEERLLRDAVKCIYIIKKVKEAVEKIEEKESVNRLVELNRKKTFENLGRIADGKGDALSCDAEKILCSMLDKDKNWSSVPFSERALLLKSILENI
jgi:hypothetical protein